jgi:hypothetical protein
MALSASQSLLDPARQAVMRGEHGQRRDQHALRLPRRTSALLVIGLSPVRWR